MLEMCALMLRECLFFLGYITGKAEFPKQLPRQEEEALIARMLDGDEAARETLITHNLRLVSHIARKYTVPGYGPDDLISIGVIGLMKAVNSYKPHAGTALGTYAARCIENEILMTLRASRKYRGDVSLQDSVGTDGEGNDITYMDILGTDPEDVDNTVIRRITLERVHRVLTTLPPRERLVLELR
ncbi:MAG: sigma-70 family RNA polymerase sigma factor, partial [Clostridiales bacterium]|nr:sigma-70 family RNA polymerase sigma factor [Clostridiales bacterium]